MSSIQGTLFSLYFSIFRLYGHLVSTYESASTRRFALGRVDCIRSASMAALRWAAAMCQGEAPDATSTMQRNNSEDSVTGKRVTFNLYSVWEPTHWPSVVYRGRDSNSDSIILHHSHWSLHMKRNHGKYNRIIN